MATPAPVDISSFLEGVQGGLADFSVANLSLVILAGLGISVGLVLAWFGFRWITRKVMSAFKKGRI